MHTIVAWSELQDTGGSLTLTAAVPDPHVRVVGDDIIVPALNKLVGVFAMGGNITLARFDSPSLRRLTNNDVSPLNVGSSVLTPSRFVDLRDNPLTLDTDEALNFLAAEDLTGAAQQTGIAILSDGDFSVPAGEIFTVRATGATTLTAYAWTNVALTFTQSLPAGVYELVGATGIAGDLVAFRFVGVGMTWRPGGIGVTALSAVPHPAFRRGGLGRWLQFSHNTPPTVDCLATAANTSETFLLDLIKIG